MARIRTVKPEFWSDEELSKASFQARLLFIGILNLADDYGICRGNVKWIKAQLFPYDDSLRVNEVSQWIDQLVKARMLVPFEIEEEGYLYIRTFNVHQKIDRPSKNGHITAEKLKRALNLDKIPGTFEEYSSSIPRILALGIGKGKGNGKDIISPIGDGGTDVPPAANPYDSIKRDKASIYAFIKSNKPTDIKPYVDLWNLFADEKKFPAVSKINDSRKRKFAIRIKDPAFDFPGVLKRAGTSDFISSGNWFSFDWIIENETNFLKVLEGKFDNKESPTNNEPINKLNEKIKAAGRISNPA